MKILTVISNYNESGAIRESVADAMENIPFKSDIIVIDNCSSDNSINILKELHVDYLIHPVNSGGSSGVHKTAFAYAFYHNYDIYCHMDGDNQHYSKEFSKLLLPFQKGEQVDIVVGSRFIEKKGFQSLLLRRLTIKIFSRLLSSITGNKITDFTSGFRVHNRNAIQFFAKQFKHEIETPSQLELLIHFGGLKKMEIPVTMKPRTTGKSEINFKNAVKFPLYNLISIIGTLINKTY